MKRREFLKAASLVGTSLLLGCRLRNRFDLIIQNGLVFDGSGAQPQQIDIGIKGDRIVALANLSQSSADDWIDASGLAVAPGFIDIHSHTDVELLVNPYAESKIFQGVTTEISGNCGDSPFPFNHHDFLEFQNQIHEKYGITVNWRDLHGFRKALKQVHPALNYATFVGHGALRAFVLGKNDVQPTEAQLATMQQILTEAMQMGALGLSTGLEYSPGSYAKVEELIELCKVVARHGGVYATHLRNEDDSVEEAVNEALQICQAASVSLQISHLKACNQANWHKEPHLLEMIAQAAEHELPVQADRYPYEAWSTGLTSFLPLWARQGDTDEVIQRLQDQRLIPELRQYAESRSQRIGGWDKIVICSCFTEQNKVYEGKSIAECARLSSKSPFEFIRTLLIVEKNRVGVIGFAMSADNLKLTLAHPLVTIGSDGNAVANHGILATGKPHPRYYGTFPRVLGKYVREEKALKLTTAIRKMTSQPATKLGLKKRGLIQPACFADLVVFNPATVIDRATFTEPHQYPIGIEHVIVNGALTVLNGKLTGARSGAILGL